ncbi:hypothetical protein F5887DRAFT_216349 [Amanita rubescens]|nr:hypothetical protein F5887DRAFT_216349 [Amanita rubescens]
MFDPWKDASSPTDQIESRIPDLAFDPWKDAPSPGNAQVQPTTVQTKSNLLLVIFIHGLKGDNKSFKTFPQRIQDILSKSLPDTTVESVVSPTWETKGELTEAVARFVKWLTLLTEEKEQGVTGSVKIVLCGHSMGGLLAADTILELVRPHRKGKAASIWPRVVACISFDTPYLGLLPPVFKNSVTEEVDAMQTIGSAVFGALAGLGAWKATGQVSPLFDIPRISWNRWVPPTVYAVGGAILAGATWYKRDDFVQFYNLAMDHIKFLDNVGDEEALEQRVNDLVDLEKSHGILFRTLYVLLPPAPPEHRNSRTFILLPWSDAPAAPHFVPVENSLATNEIWAHMGMFAATTNDGYHELEVDVAKIIEDALF